MLDTTSEDGLKGLVFPTNDLVAFRKVLTNLYATTLQKEDVSITITTVDFGLGVYIFTDRLLYTKLQTTITNIIRKALVADNLVFELGQISYIYTNTLPSSPLRKFAIDVIFDKGAAKKSPEGTSWHWTLGDARTKAVAGECSNWSQGEGEENRGWVGSFLVGGETGIM